MRLIDADELRIRAEMCMETTDAFTDLIDRMPTVTEVQQIYAKPIQHNDNSSGHPSMAEGAWYTCPVCGSFVIPHMTRTCTGCGIAMLWQSGAYNE